jgi:hypothetical protein
MTLTFHDKEKIITDFPITKLSYEKKIHKKVSHTELFLIIPKGEKGFIWFRQYKGQPICLSMRLENANKIKDIEIQLAAFNPNLCIQRGTILYGTFFIYNKRCFFSIEDSFYFMNKNIMTFSQYQKLQLQYSLLNEYLKQTVLANNNIIFGLPYMVTNQYDAREMFHNITYPPSHIQHRMLHKRAVYLNQYIKQNKYAVFSIRSSIKTDIYFLYCVLKDDTLYKYGICDIPDFNTSKMMNNLFRDIKENRNLDALEESDDEDDFEDISPEKYVYLNRIHNMLCVYNRKFNRWQPLKIEENKQITKREIICQMEKK